MLKEVIHIGLTVRDIDRSIAFYRDLLGLALEGQLVMEGEATDRLFGRKGCRCRVAYLNGGSTISAPPVELLAFTDKPAEPSPPALFQTSISELCFRVADIAAFHRHLVDHGVDCLSEPQLFDFTATGFGKSLAFYFRDPDGIILEAMQTLP